MAVLINISLMTYFTFVSIIGTLGNGVILLAYGNRWNSSKSTSVIFILILACVDLWTCLVVVPTIAIMEYREFVVPTLICRFYSFSKNLIIISSFIMSFIALDRFLNIALPHYRLLNPRRVKVLLILFISIGIGLGTLTALAFSTQAVRKVYLTDYNLLLPNESSIRTNNKMEISLEPDQNASLSSDTIHLITEQISVPDGANITIINLAYIATSERCFADTSIISETLRDVLKHVSNKVFYTLIGIVTIFYTITFVLALRRQNPRIRALKKSLHVLNKFDSYPPPKSILPITEPIVSLQCQSSSSVTATTVSSKQTTTTTTTLSNDHVISKPTITESSINPTEQEYEMSKFINNDDSDDQTLPSPPSLRKVIRIKKKSQSQIEQHVSSSDNTSDELQPSTEKLNGTKQVSFQIDHRRNTLPNEQKKHLSISTNSFDANSNGNNDMYYKFPCPCSTTRQLLIKFHFARPSLELSKWLCCFCVKKQSTINYQTSIINHNEEETVTILPVSVPNHHPVPSNSDTLRKQLHRHRLKQLRMASTFLIITVSFVLFYLPSILNAERIMKSPIMIYYLFLCTHALNPLIYCFMNPNLRAYVISMFKCHTRRKKGNIRGRKSFFER